MRGISTLTLSAATTTIPVYVNMTTISPAGTVMRIYYGNDSVTTNNEASTPTLYQFHGTATTSYNLSPSVDPVNTSYVTRDVFTATGASNFIGVSNTSAFTTNSMFIQCAYTNSPVYNYKAGASTTANIGAPSAGVYYLHGINRTATYSNFTRNDITSPIKLTANLPTVPVGIGKYQTQGTSSQNWSLIRKWVENEPIPTVYSSITSAGTAPVASFTDDRIFKPYELSTIQFTDTSTNTPTSWCWTFFQIGNSTPTIFAPNTQNPTNVFSNGTYYIALNVTNAYGNDTTISAPFTVHLADNFTHTSNPSVVEDLVTFVPNATSPATVFNWTFGDFGDGNTSANSTATHRYGAAGTYTAILVAESVFGNSTISATHIVSNLSGYNQQDIDLDPQFTLTIHITDSATGAVIPVNIVTTSDGQTYTTTNGTAYFTVPYSTVVVYVTSTGYYGVSTSYVMDMDRDETIQLSKTEDTSVQQQVYPHYVTFHLKEGFGSPIEDVEVSVIGVSTSTGNWDWVAQLLGLPLNEVPINGTYMNQTTDSLGRATFYLIPTGKYNITFTKTGYTITPMVLVPQDTDYVIFAVSTSEPYFREGIDEISAVNITVTTTAYNESYSFINLTYYDSTGKTTGGTIQVLQKSDTPWAANTVMATWPVTGNSFTNSTAIMHVQQVSGYVSANITHTSFGYVTRSYPYAFNSVPVQFLGFGQEIALLVAFGMMAFTLMLAGAAHVRPVLFLVCIEGWVFDAMHWFDSMIDRGVPHEAVWTALTIATIIAILANFEMRKKKEKY